VQHLATAMLHPALFERYQTLHFFGDIRCTFYLTNTRTVVKTVSLWDTIYEQQQKNKEKRQKRIAFLKESIKMF